MRQDDQGPKNYVEGRIEDALCTLKNNRNLIIWTEPGTFAYKGEELKYSEEMDALYGLVDLGGGMFKIVVKSQVKDPKKHRGPKADSPVV